jgi:poly(A)-specific ribonuclease
MQVINKHFKDLSYVRVNGDNFCSQQLVVYTESKDDKDLLMVG